MTTKQLQQSAAAGHGIGAELLLRSWNKTLEVVDQAKKINKESGVRDPHQNQNIIHNHSQIR